MAARHTLTALAREQGWEVGEYPSYVECSKTGFIRGSTQVRVVWTETGNVEHAVRVAKHEPQVVLDHTDRGKREAVASWLRAPAG